MTKTLALIPARGGSKRIPHKNLLSLAGKPLLAYTVDTALESGIFEDVVVSSDDEKILALSCSLGALVDRRPESLTGDTIRFVQVVEEYLLRPERRAKYQNIVGLLPTCPFRTVDDIHQAFDLFNQQSQEVFLVSVTAYDFPPQLALSFGEDELTLSMHDPTTYRRTTQSQRIAKMYHPNGALYMATVEGFLREKTFFAEPLVGYVMPPERSFDIDYPYQFHIAEWIMQKKTNAR